MHPPQRMADEHLYIGEYVEGQKAAKNLMKGVFDLANKKALARGPLIVDACFINVPCRGLP